MTSNQIPQEDQSQKNVNDDLYIKQSSNNKNKDSIKEINNLHKTHYVNSQIKIHTQPNQTLESENQQYKTSFNYIQGLGMSEFQSSSTLKHSIQSFTISKEERFNYLKQQPPHQYYKLQDNLKLPSIFEVNKKKGAGMGYGSKQTITPYIVQNMEKNPGVAQYNLTDNIKISEKGYSFGVGREKFKKNYIPGHIDPEVKKHLPAPNHYDQKLNNFGKEKNHITMSGRHDRIYSLQVPTPAPNQYTINHQQVQASRFNGSVFGREERNPLNHLKQKLPGPGSYKIPSKFDKFIKKKL